MQGVALCENWSVNCWFPERVLNCKFKHRGILYSFSDLKDALSQRFSPGHKMATQVFQLGCVWSRSKNVKPVRKWYIAILNIVC